MTNNLDIITYSGAINRSGYESVCAALENKKSDKVMLMLGTPGGDPHSGFRIARALQHHYGQFDALIPRYCKSAGTLILIGAQTIYMDDMSELGPLDIQVKKGDELIGRNSGLDIFQAVNYLQSQCMTAFLSYLYDLTQNSGLSTKIASDIAARLTSGLFEPIAGQIDPLKLAEMQRATEIAFAYGFRLNEKSNNMRSTGIQKLVTGYPSHGFVIDRKEARSIFINVEEPTDGLANISKALHTTMFKDIDSDIPSINLYTLPLTVDDEEPPNEATPDTTDSSGSTTASE